MQTQALCVWERGGGGGGGGAVHGKPLVAKLGSLNGDHVSLQGHRVAGFVGAGSILLEAKLGLPIDASRSATLKWSIGRYVRGLLQTTSVSKWLKVAWGAKCTLDAGGINKKFGLQKHQTVALICCAKSSRVNLGRLALICRANFWGKIVWRNGEWCIWVPNEATIY